MKWLGLARTERSFLERQKTGTHIQRLRAHMGLPIHLIGRDISVMTLCLSDAAYLGLMLDCVHEGMYLFIIYSCDKFTKSIM